MWADWQNAKGKGLKYAQDFIRNSWATDSGFGLIQQVDQNLLNKILKGELKSFNEIKTFQQEEIVKNGYPQLSVSYTVFYYTLFDKERKTNLILIDSIFINS
ncbi:hypothetical protein IUY40_09370 [Flavobacterium sp. ALJ2]|uniref:hypothetical protein n=1 Tax=Flavobacterium sp. ALJ2 TaxID=2786960 RepID=UPI0018A07A78|nr:hypothetical protein [Flavobacterium sp. ALJ2]MBF7091751.1 hypothetical protein [Flavobacterium sp. ALJ2]